MLNHHSSLVLVLIFTISTALVNSASKYRMCVVDGNGGFQKSDNYCPKLEAPESKVECVKAFDRFDCLRKIRKGVADFSIFTPEDLIAAANTDNDILITNELRNSDTEPYEEQIVAVVSDASGIKSTYEMHDKILCHPGYGSDGFTSEVLTNFLETTIIRPPSCQASLTVPENRILAASKFFKSACKPGPWVNEPEIDRELKRKYPNLCDTCGSPSACSTDDKYYGSSGSLLCLKDGAGDISWTTYQQVRLQFDLDSNNTDELSGFKFLCKDDSLKPLNSTNPCTWVVKPWPVVAANRDSAAGIQKIVANITHTTGWQGALLDLFGIVNYHVVINTLDGTEAVDSYLSKIPGYLNANSFTGCHTPRTIRICTTSIPAQYKCGWMREAAAVQGLEPDIDCLKADNATHCMEAIQRKIADVVIAHPDYLNVAVNQYNLKPLFYETVEVDDKYLTVAVVNLQSNMKTIDDLKGKRACFPSYDGVSWNTVIHELRTRKLLSGCPHEKAMASFFGDSCVPGIPSDYSGSLGKLCRGGEFNGEEGALACLKNGIADVAFVSQNNLREFFMKKDNKFDFRVICDQQPCHLSWAPPAQAMVTNNISSWRDNDILDVFLELDNLFGAKFQEATRMFTMYGEFDGKHNILFNDNTVKLKKTPKLREYDDMPRQYDAILKNIKHCEKYSSSSRSVPSILGLFIIILISYAFKIDF